MIPSYKKNQNSPWKTCCYHNSCWVMTNIPKQSPKPTMCWAIINLILWKHQSRIQVNNHMINQSINLTKSRSIYHLLKWKENYIAAAKQAISHCNADLKTSQRLNGQSIRFNKPTLKPGKMESKTPKTKTLNQQNQSNQQNQPTHLKVKDC